MHLGGPCAGLSAGLLGNPSCPLKHNYVQPAPFLTPPARPPAHLPCLPQLFEEEGTDLAQALTQKEHIAAMKKMDLDVAKALSRLSGGRGSAGRAGAGRGRAGRGGRALLTAAW